MIKLFRGRIDSRGFFGLWILAVGLLAAGCTPDPVSQPADLAIANVRVWSEGLDLDEASVTIRAGRFSTVVAGGPAEDAAETIDFSDQNYTAIPGLIDTHVHLIPSGGVRSAADMQRYMDESLEGRLDSFLASGTTTVYDNGDYWPAIGEVRDRVARGELAGPRILAVGLILTAPDGHPASTICVTNPYCREFRLVELDDAQQARDVVDRLAAEGVDGIKVVFEAESITMDRAVLDAVVAQAHLHELPVDAHTETVSSSIEAVEAGVDRLVHPPRFGEVAGTDFVDLAADRGVRVAATVGSGGPGNPEYDEAMAALFDVLAENVRALRAVDVPLSFGTDNAGGPALLRVSWEASALSAIGMSNVEILNLMTADSARYLGRGDELGKVAPGMIADLVVVAGDPGTDLAVLQNVVLVVRDGVVLVDNR